MVLGPFDAGLSVLVASVGNTLGGMSSFYLGRLGKMAWIGAVFESETGTKLTAGKEP